MLRTYSRCPQRDSILVKEIRHSLVKGEGRERVHFGSLEALWEGMRLRLYLQRCGQVRRREKTCRHQT